MIGHILGAIVNAWWGGIAIVAVLQLHDALVHIGNAMMARAKVEREKIKAAK